MLAYNFYPQNEIRHGIPGMAVLSSHFVPDCFPKFLRLWFCGSIGCIKETSMQRYGNIAET